MAKTLKLVDIPRYEDLVQAIKKCYRDVARNRYKLRDLALVATLVFTGCRIGEATKIRRDDVDFENKTVRIHQEKKKKKEFIRVVPIPSNLYWLIMKQYVESMPRDQELLFPITTRMAREIVYRFTATYLGKKVRPHAIRHSYAIFVLKTTKDLEAVRRLLGHSDYKWLKAYLEYTQEDLAEELEKAFTRLELEL